MTELVKTYRTGVRFPAGPQLYNRRTAMETFGFIFAVILLIGLLIAFYKNT